MARRGNVRKSLIFCKALRLTALSPWQTSRKPPRQNTVRAFADSCQARIAKPDAARSISAGSGFRSPPYLLPTLTSIDLYRPRCIPILQRVRESDCNAQPTIAARRMFLPFVSWRRVQNSQGLAGTRQAQETEVGELASR